MKEENAIRDKSYLFSVRCVKLYQYLVEKKSEYVLSKQFLRSGTSIGANVVESQFGQTRADFAMKLSIAQKEAAETEYWLKLLREGKYLDEREFKSMFDDCGELMRLFQAITATLYDKRK